MIRWIAVFSTLLALTGCVTTREVVYRDGYSYSRDDGYAERRYYDENGNYYADEDRRTVYRDGSYYEPGYAGGGDYYYGSSYGGDAYSSSYWDYPAYYSVFWPMYRSWYDPYWYPSYYYGVTYYPRNYLSIGFGSGWNRPYYSSWYYSPYRYSWADNYYDWSPWHGYRHSHRDYRSSPRYGSSRNEAERLARLGGGRYQPSPRRSGYDGVDYHGNDYRGNGYRGGDGRTSAVEGFGRTRGTNRDADYRGKPGARQEPATGAFGIPTRSDPRGDSRRVGSAGGRDFSVPVDPNTRRTMRNADYGTLPQRPPAATRRYDAGDGYSRSYSGGVDRRNAPQDAPRYETKPAARAARGYDAGVAMPRETNRGMPTYERRNAPQDYSRGAGPAFESRRYEAPVMRNEPSRGRGYDGGGSPSNYSMPAREPSYQARPEPRYESKAETRAEPRFESRQESRSDDRGGEGRRGESKRGDRN